MRQSERGWVVGTLGVRMVQHNRVDVLFNCDVS
jgi:hypothetical protein